MTAERIRAHKAIAAAGLASRREAERMIQAGLVRINGEVVREPGASVVPGEDILELDGTTVPLVQAQKRELWALYKPRDCVSTLHDPEGRPTLKDFFPRSAARLFPIGRLDYDAEGLILLTNDGALAHQIAHPSFQVRKTYLVKVKGLVLPEALTRLGRGPVLEGRSRSPVRARVLHTVNDKTWLEVTLTEGIQHHIKKMFAAEGHRVLKIKRFQIGPITLEEMQPGQCRRLSEQDIEALLQPDAKGRKRAGHAPKGAPRRARR